MSHAQKIAADACSVITNKKDYKVCHDVVYHALTKPGPLQGTMFSICVESAYQYVGPQFYFNFAASSGGQQLQSLEGFNPGDLWLCPTGFPFGGTSVDCEFTISSPDKDSSSNTYQFTASINDLTPITATGVINGWSYLLTFWVPDPVHTGGFLVLAEVATVSYNPAASLQ
jgi:hypothetical protein